MLKPNKLPSRTIRTIRTRMRSKRPSTLDQSHHLIPRMKGYHIRSDTRLLSAGNLSRVSRARRWRVTVGRSAVQISVSILRRFLSTISLHLVLFLFLPRSFIAHPNIRLTRSPFLQFFCAGSLLVSTRLIYSSNKSLEVSK